MRTPGRCSVTTAYSKHWKQQGFAKSSRSMPGRRRRTRWGGGRLCWEASGQEAAYRYRVLLNGPHTSQAIQLSHGHSFHQLWGPLHQARVPCAWVSWVHASSSMQAAMQQAVVAPALAPAEDFEEQTVEESNQRWAAISTWERTARKGLEHKSVLQITMHLIWRANLSTLYFSGSISRGYPELLKALRELRNEGPSGTMACACTWEGVKP